MALTLGVRCLLATSIHGPFVLCLRRCKIFTCVKIRQFSPYPRCIHPRIIVLLLSSAVLICCLPSCLDPFLVSAAVSSLHQFLVFRFIVVFLVTTSPSTSPLPITSSSNQNVVCVCSCQPSRIFMDSPSCLHQYTYGVTCFVSFFCRLYVLFFISAVRLANRHVNATASDHAYTFVSRCQNTIPLLSPAVTVQPTRYTHPLRSSSASLVAVNALCSRCCNLLLKLRCCLPRLLLFVLPRPHATCCTVHHCIVSLYQHQHAYGLSGVRP
jgi:hypothetical protein